MSVRKQADCPCLDLPISLSASYDDHLIFASGLAWVPVHLHAGAFGFFGGRCVTGVLFSKNVFVPEICFFRFAVTDYMYVAASCLHSGRFFWNLFLNYDTGFAFYFERELHFSQKKEDCLKKTALVDFF